MCSGKVSNGVSLNFFFFQILGLGTGLEFERRHIFFFKRLLSKKAEQRPVQSNLKSAESEPESTFRVKTS